MEQHPIPQQISSYQFRLVGDMTLKQFFQLAGGFLVALIIYSIPVIGIVKWPFVILSALLGAAMAFVPLEERPLERWIFAFFRAIYSPTEFFWQTTRTPIKFYADEPAEAAQPAGPQAEALDKYLSSADQKTGSAGKLEGAEQGFFAKLTGIVSELVVQATGGPVVNKQTSESVNNQISQNTTTLPVTPIQTPIAPKIQPSANKQIQIPQTAPIKIERAAPTHLVVEEKNAQDYSMATNRVAPILAGEEIVSTKQAVFSIDAAPPNPPTYPNVVVGQVVDADRKIVEGAIIEIKDSSGRPIRALRSNRAGHFITVTPLDVGRYDIFTEKEGYEFTPVSFDANGGIIPPILVEGKMSVQNVTLPVANMPIQPILNTNSQ